VPPRNNGPPTLNTSLPQAFRVYHGSPISMNKLRLVKVRNHLRKNPTPFELIFKRKLRRWKIAFKEQKIISGFIADFFLPQYGLVIEIDGAAHYTYHTDRDKRRDDVLRKNGLTVLRIRNPEVPNYQKEDILSFVDKIGVRPIQNHNFLDSYMATLH
jgi:very-short-patch-repair endonuclease